MISLRKCFNHECKTGVKEKYFLKIENFCYFKYVDEEVGFYLTAKTMIGGVAAWPSG